MIDSRASRATASISARVLAVLLPYRRAADPAEAPDHPEQLFQIEQFVRAGEPIVFTLPGFPCKSTNPAKVLGPLPDESERLSLRFLDRLCARIAEVYPPGARLVICAEGHVFGDLIGVSDAHIDAYVEELRAIVRRERLTRLTTFDLREVYGDLPYAGKRALVDAVYAPSMESLWAQARADADTQRLYRGIARSLAEDARAVAFPGPRSALRRAHRDRAYGVLRRSRAWCDLIADHHPRSVRLSVHPQRSGAAKFGIRLLEADDVWATPWHSAALRCADGGWRLMRRADAERLGRLVVRHGRPSHFEAR
ncbi:isocyanide synthase family protein [Streptomyces sp. SAJ15]|uniref:isocyanide synthase family protein n=1 Tax=Streptomyces sp. SAJ15 TaxID=2011095 RepID=UPI001185E9BC|nr:isocyanide synthase family protein [Streptomyces sp. SAJ15]TVL93245.1 pyoverdine biosynthesis protein PvcA [Streptomyces sp. SAJ15]